MWMMMRCKQVDGGKAVRTHTTRGSGNMERGARSRRRVSGVILCREMLSVADQGIDIHSCMHTPVWQKWGRGEQQRESKIVLSALHTHDSMQPAPLTTDCT